MYSLTAALILAGGEGVKSAIRYAELINTFSYHVIYIGLQLSECTCNNNISILCILPARITFFSRLCELTDRFPAEPFFLFGILLRRDTTSRRYDSSVTFKVSHTLGCRPLLRIRLSVSCFPVRLNARCWIANRFLSGGSSRQSWIQDRDELGEEAREHRLSGRIYILGLGNVGNFVAHSLATRRPRPPITLMLHNSDLYLSWVERRRQISIFSDGLDDIKSGFDINVRSNEAWYSLPYSTEGVEREGDHDLNERLLKKEAEEALAEAEQDDGYIECLIVTCKAADTVRALTTVKHRLRPESTVLLLQNGMGVIDELNNVVFPDPSRRPNYMCGVLSHGLMRRAPFQVAHTGVGTTILSPSPSGNVADAANYESENENDWAPTTKYLLRTLTLTPPLVAVAVPSSDLLQYQLEKLAMNCVINPLTAILDCQNGEPLYHFSSSRVARLLLIEISNVICALPELQGVPGIEHRFSTERLRHMTVKVMSKTARNTSSMLQDVRARRNTEIDYLNGYVVRRGEELGIKCALNYMLIHLLTTKRGITAQRENEAIPIVRHSELPL